MDSTVTVALIAAAGTIISGICSAVISNKVTTVRIDQLEKKVDTHNRLIERTYQLEAQMTAAQHDIEQLQKGTSHG